MYRKSASIIHKLLSNNLFRMSYQFGKKISTMILNTKTNEQLTNLLTKYHGNFDLYNVLTLLKKINDKNIKNIQINDKLIDLAYKELMYTIKFVKKLNDKNSKPLAHLVGYLGKIGEHRLDHFLKSIDLKNIFQYIKQMEFSMLIIGLLKLNLIQLVAKDEDLAQFLKNHITNKFHFGLNVTLWKNLINFQKNNKEINQFFAENLGNCSFRQNFIDFGYLVFCYMQTYTQFESTKLLQTIKQCSQHIEFFPSINIFELCIFTSSFMKFINTTKIKLSDIIYKNIQNYFKQILKTSKITLKQLTIGFTSYHCFMGKVIDQIQIEVTNKYLQLLNKKKENIEHYYQVICIFHQLIFVLDESSRSQGNDIWNKNHYERISIIVKKILELYFDPKQQSIKKMENNQFRKLLSCFSMFMEQNEAYELSIFEKQLIEESIIERMQLNKKQIIAITLALQKLKIKKKKICQHIKFVGEQELKKFPDYNLKKVLFKDQCILGYKSKHCQQCWKLS